MNYKVHISKPAKLDIKNAIKYIVNVLKNPTAANHLLQKAETGIASLSIMPQRCALANDSVLSSWGIRSLMIENYIAFYQIDETTQTVHILRFLYKKSDWKNILKFDNGHYDNDLFLTKNTSILSDVK